MSKFKAALLGAVCAFAGSSAGAAVLGPDAQQCVSGSGPAILVHVVGIKDKSGTVRARAFGGNPSTWFNKKTWLRRTVVPTPGAGTADICLAVPKPGTYAVDIRHGRITHHSRVAHRGRRPLLWRYPFCRQRDRTRRLRRPAVTIPCGSSPVARP